MLDCDQCDRKKIRIREIALAAGEMEAGCNVNHDVRLRRWDRNKCRRTRSEPGGCEGRTFQAGEATEQYLRMGVRSWAWCVQKSQCTWMCPGRLRVPSGSNAKRRGRVIGDEIGKVTSFILWEMGSHWGLWTEEWWTVTQVLKAHCGYCEQWCKWRDLFRRLLQSSPWDVMMAWTRWVVMEVEKRLDSWFIVEVELTEFPMDWMLTEAS